MSDSNEKKADGADASTSRMVFLAVVFMLGVWVTLMVVLPALTGKPGVVQKMQSDLQNSDKQD